LSSQDIENVLEPAEDHVLFAAGGMVEDDKMT
jgi:hypothetical protein